MFIDLIIKGIIAGFSLAAPGEAVGFLCLKETKRNFITGLATGLGAAQADLFYGIIAVLIFQLSRSTLIEHPMLLTLIGGLFLCAFGAKRLCDSLLLDTVKIIQGSPIRVCILSFFFTLTNGSTILEFISLFIGFDIEFAGYHELLVFVSGVFLGSLLWWIVLSLADELLQKKISMKALHYLNYASGMIIIGFGIYTLSKLRQF